MEVASTMPYFQPAHVLWQWAREATLIADKLCRRANDDADQFFLKWIDRSIDQGSKELHAYVRNEPKPELAIKTDKGIITDITKPAPTTLAWRETVDDRLNRLDSKFEAAPHRTHTTNVSV